jgi:hypothetical protein
VLEVDLQQKSQFNLACHEKSKLLNTLQWVVWRIHLK